MVDGRPNEGTFKSHQVPLSDPAKIPSIYGSWKTPGCATISPRNCSTSGAA